MNKKRIIGILLILTLTLSGFTGCGSSKDEESGAGNQPTGGVSSDENADTDDDVNADADADADEDKDTVEDEDNKSENDGEEKDNESDKNDKNDSKPEAGNTASKPSSGNGSSSSSKPAASSKPSSSSKPSGSSKPADNKKDEIKAPSGTPSDIIDKIYEKKSIDLPLETAPVDLSDLEMTEMVTGLTSVDLVDSAAYSESMMGSQAYSLVVVKVKNKKNTEKIAKEMLNGINPRKWICVEADDLRVAAAGDVVVLIMVASEFEDTVTSKEIVDIFKSLCGGLDVSLKN